jgi:hypothetical protein
MALLLSGKTIQQLYIKHQKVAVKCGSRGDAVWWILAYNACSAQDVDRREPIGSVFGLVHAAVVGNHDCRDVPESSRST